MITGCLAPSHSKTYSSECSRRNPKNRHLGLCTGRQPVLPVRLRTDVPRLFRDTNCPRHGQGIDQGRLPDDPSKTGIIEHTPLIAQVMFFGALLSAIKSTASATLLAPSVTFTENLLRPMMPTMSDRQLLMSMRIVTLVFTFLVTVYAMHSDATIFEMVENAYQITFGHGLHPPGLRHLLEKSHQSGALLAIFLGVTTWLSILVFGSEDPFVPAHLERCWPVPVG